MMMIITTIIIIMIILIFIIFIISKQENPAVQCESPSIARSGTCDLLQFFNISIQYHLTVGAVQLHNSGFHGGPQK